jgi:hypothetical protein
MAVITTIKRLIFVEIIFPSNVTLPILEAYTNTKILYKPTSIYYIEAPKLNGVISQRTLVVLAVILISADRTFFIVCKGKGDD